MSIKSSFFLLLKSIYIFLSFCSFMLKALWWFQWRIWELTNVHCCMCKKERCKHENKNIRKKWEGGPIHDDLILSDKSTMLWKKISAEDAKNVCMWMSVLQRQKGDREWMRESFPNVCLCLIIILKVLDSLTRQMPKCECMCQCVNMCDSAFFFVWGTLRHFWHLFPAPCHASVWPPPPTV